MGKKHASLFSGFGAGDLAATWVGWDNTFWCEIDGFCQTVLSYWFPKSIGYGNIKETNFMPWRGKIDVLTGGFPCQPFSVAGQRKGADDDRYLWPEMLRAIREIQPTWVIGENVGGIISMVQPGSEVAVENQASLFEESDKETILNQDSVVETVCRDLEQEGYSVQPIVIPACAVGAPHRRDRVWFIAYRSNSGTESMQRERKNGVYESKIASNAYRNDARRSGHEKTGCKAEKSQTRKREWKRVWSNIERIGKERITPYAYGKRCNNRSDNREKRPIYYDWKRYSKENQSERNEWKCGTRQNGSFASNAQRKGSGQIQQEIQSEQSNGNSINGISHERDAADSDCKQLENGMRAWNRFSEPTNIYCKRTWHDFPTQPPVCRGNDGLPFDVVRLTIPFTKWREGSVKGYGNAIVPQVIYEIFKAIEAIEI